MSFGTTITAADKRLARELGLSPDVIFSARREHLQRGSGLGRGKWIKYTPEGIARIKSVLGLNGHRPPPEPQQQPPPATKPERLLVLGRYPNPIFVRVRDPKGKPADVQVRDNHTLSEGVLLSCMFDGSRWRCTDPHFKPY